MNEHYHSCPYCYEAWRCTDTCTICPDLEDRGRDFGSNTICHDVICHIDRAIKKHNERYEQRQHDALRRLQRPMSEGERATIRMMQSGSHTLVAAALALAERARLR